MTGGTFRSRIKALLTLGDSPARLSLAFAMGVFIAFSPLIGLHTAMAFACIWLFRMNPVALFAGALISNPWTFVPICGFSLWLGMGIWPTPDGLPPLSFRNVDLLAFFGQFKPYLMPFVVGSTVAGLVAAVAGYGAMRYLVQTYRQRKARPQAAAEDP